MHAIFRAYFALCAQFKVTLVNSFSSVCSAIAVISLAGMLWMESSITHAMQWIYLTTIGGRPKHE